MRKALAYSKKLEDVGLTREQAEVHLEILDEIVEDEMATKSDLLSVKSVLQREIQSVKSDLQTEIQTVKSDLQIETQSVKSDLQTEIQTVKSDVKAIRKDLDSKASKLDLANLESKLIRWNGAVVCAAVVVLSGVQVWLFFLLKYS